jgi:hypothetical protein
MAPPRKMFKELFLMGYRFVQIRVGGITEIEVFFAAYNTDGETNYVCPYAFFEKMPSAAQAKVDSEMVGSSKLGHSVSVIGSQGPVLKYDPVTPIGLDELTGLGSPVATGNIGIVAQRGTEFLARINIDNDRRRDGRDFRGFILDFAGTAPRDLVGKVISGSFVSIGTPVISMTPWGVAERKMKDFFEPFMSQ